MAVMLLLEGEDVFGHIARLAPAFEMTPEGESDEDRARHFVTSLYATMGIRVTMARLPAPGALAARALGIQALEDAQGPVAVPSRRGGGAA